jgi:hypothetical protein
VKGTCSFVTFTVLFFVRQVRALIIWMLGTPVFCHFCPSFLSSRPQGEISVNSGKRDIIVPFCHLRDLSQLPREIFAFSPVGCAPELQIAEDLGPAAEVLPAMGSHQACGDRENWFLPETMTSTLPERS